MAWLSGWDNRIKLTIDYTKIDYAELGYEPQYPLAQNDTYVKATTKYNEEYWPYYSTDPTKDLTGNHSTNSWLSEAGVTTEQRFHIDLGSAKVIDRIYYENAHNSGGSTDNGAKNFTFWGSNTGAGSFDDLVYANDEGWTELTCSQNTLDEHIELDQADPKYITVTNSTEYRYYAFKFADSYGNLISVRRIELQTRIDELTWFPVTVFLDSTHGDGVFDKLVSDANRFKIAFTKTDGVTELYGEIEKWDDANEVAVIHVSRDGWTISASEDIDFYLYYDADHADNTTYIGDIDSVPGAAVWDSNFKLVYHMRDVTTSTIKDSTSNSNDGTKKGVNEPIEVASKVGFGQDFDGSDDYIDITDKLCSSIPKLTFESLVKVNSVLTDSSVCLYRENDCGWNGTGPEFIIRSNTLIPTFTICNSYPPVPSYVLSSDAISLSTWYLLTATYDKDSNAYIYMNDTVKGGEIQAGVTPVSTFNGKIGWYDNTVGVEDWNDIEVCEFRLSHINRLPSWTKATYNSLWNTLLTYGSEESSGWTGKINGVTNPAKINGIAVANIAKVNGV